MIVRGVVAVTANSVAPVVAGIHDSPSNLHVVRAAAVEAAAQNRPLCLLHAFNWIPAYPTETCAWSHQAAEQLLVGAEEIARAQEPTVTTRSEITEGSAVSALLHASRTAALIVLGDGNLADYVSLPIDAAAVKVAAEAECSVLVVRDAPQPAGPVVVGVDGSPRAEQALACAFESAAYRGAELVVVQVEEPAKDPSSITETPPVPPRPTSVAQWQQKYPGVVVRERKLHGDPSHLLVEAAKDAAMLVVGARGERPLRGMLGPVCLSALHHAPCPVFVVRGQRHPPGSDPT